MLRKFMLPVLQSVNFAKLAEIFTYVKDERRSDVIFKAGYEILTYVKDD